MPKAKQKDLEDLHGSLAKVMKDVLAGTDETPAATLGQIRQFLSDNKIEADMVPTDPEEFLHADDEFDPPDELNAADSIAATAKSKGAQA